MLPDDVEVADVDPLQWRRLRDALAPPAPRPALFVLHARGEALAAWDTSRGRRPDLLAAVAEPAAHARRLHAVEGVGQVWVVDVAAGGRVEDRDQRVWLPTLLGLPQPAGRPGLAAYPEAQPGRAARRLRDALLPARDGATLLAVFTGDELWTSVVVCAAGGRARRIGTVDGAPQRASAWRSAVDRYVDRTARRHGPVARGLFLSHDGFLRLLRSEDPPACLRAAESSGAAITVRG